MSRKILLLIALVVLAGVGFAGWRLSRTKVSSGRTALVQAQENPGAAAAGQAFDSGAANLRLTLNNLLREHTYLNAEFLTALYQNADTSQPQQLLKDNQDQLAALIQNAYGGDIRNRFIDLWSRHMSEYQNYALASRSNQTAKMSAAGQNLDSIADDMGKLFAAAGGNLDAAALADLMREHNNATLAIVDAISHRDTGLAATLTKTSYDQAGRLADTLARGMILDKPNMFNG